MSIYGWVANFPTIYRIKEDQGEKRVNVLLLNNSDPYCWSLLFIVEFF